MTPSQYDKLERARELIQNGTPVYRACDEVGLTLNKWYTMNKKPIWKEAKKQLPKGPVLVVYLAPFFGKLIPKTTVGYYDNPTDYAKEDEGEGWLEWSTDRPLLVTHWMYLPILPPELESFSIEQEDAKKKIPKIFERHNLGTVNLQELK